MHQRGLLLEYVEQAAQAVHVRGEVRRRKQISFTGNDQFIRAVGERRVTRLYRCAHQPHDVLTQLLELVSQQSTDGMKGLPRVMTVEEIGGLDQLRLGVGADRDQTGNAIAVPPRYTAEAIASRRWLRQCLRDVRAPTNRPVTLN